MMPTGTPLPKDLIQQIREEVLKGKSKYRVARELGVNEYVVYSHTIDLPSIKLGELCIKGRALVLLKQLLKKDFVYSDIKTNYFLRRLRRFLPMIQRSQIQGKSIYYLDDKSKLALQEMILHNPSKIIEYRELSQMSKVFNVQLTGEEKTRFLGKKTTRRMRKMKKSPGYHGMVSKEKQSRLDDFLGRFLHSEVLSSAVFLHMMYLNKKTRIIYVSYFAKKY